MIFRLLVSISFCRSMSLLNLYFSRLIYYFILYFHAYPLFGINFLLNVSCNINIKHTDNKNSFTILTFVFFFFNNYLYIICYNRHVTFYSLNNELKVKKVYIIFFHLQYFKTNILKLCSYI